MRPRFCPQQLLSMLIVLAVLSGCTTDPAKNRPPTILAGADQTVNAGDSVQMYSLLSIDPDDDAITFTWKQVAGEPVTLHPDPNGAWWRAPTTPGDSNFVFELKGSDGESDGYDTTKVLVHRPPTPPTDPCTDPNVKKVSVTVTITFPSGNPARYVGLDGFACGGSTPWVQAIEIWNGGLTTYSYTLPAPVNYPNGSAMHTVRLYWWDTGYSDYSQSSGWITVGQFTMNGVPLSQETAPRQGYAGLVPCSPVKTAICDPAPYQKFWIDSNGVVTP